MVFSPEAAQSEFTARKPIVNLPARGTEKELAVYLAAETGRRRQTPMTSIVKGSATAALYDALGIEPRQVHVPFDMPLLVQGVVFFWS
jgi:hypothetical protein